LRQSVGPRARGGATARTASASPACRQIGRGCARVSAGGRQRATGSHRRVAGSDRAASPGAHRGRALDADRSPRTTWGTGKKRVTSRKRQGAQRTFASCCPARGASSGSESMAEGGTSPGPHIAMSCRPTSDGTFVATRLVLGISSAARLRLLTRLLAQPRPVGTAFHSFSRTVASTMPGLVPSRIGATGAPRLQSIIAMARRTPFALWSAATPSLVHGQRSTSATGSDWLRYQAANINRADQRSGDRDRRAGPSDNPLAGRHSSLGVFAGATDWYLKLSAQQARWRALAGCPRCIGCAHGRVEMFASTLQAEWPGRRDPEARCACTPAARRPRIPPPEARRTARHRRQQFRSPQPAVEELSG